MKRCCCKNSMYLTEYIGIREFKSLNDTGCLDFALFQKLTYSNSLKYYPVFYVDLAALYISLLKYFASLETLPLFFNESRKYVGNYTGRHCVFQVSILKLLKTRNNRDGKSDLTASSSKRLSPRLVSLGLQYLAGALRHARRSQWLSS